MSADKIGEIQRYLAVWEELNDEPNVGYSFMFDEIPLHQDVSSSIWDSLSEFMYDRSLECRIAGIEPEEVVNWKEQLAKSLVTFVFTSSDGYWWADDFTALLMDLFGGSDPRLWRLDAGHLVAWLFGVEGRLFLLSFEILL